MNVPTLSQFIEALNVVRLYLLDLIEKAKVQFPALSDRLDALALKLNLGGLTVEVLAEVAQELKVFGVGVGPVVHKPEDLA